MPGIGERWRTSAARYASFMSYSHAADGKLAPALQRGIERLGKPWYRRPIIRVFRDETSLSANPGLWSGIQAALEQCEYFLLMCSQKSAASPWVQKEVEWWLANRPANRLLLVITDGEVAWDPVAQDFDWSRTSCVPLALTRRFTEEPYYIDLRWAKDRTDLSLRNPKFRSAVLTLSATLHGRPMEELDSEDIRQQRSLRIVGMSTLAIVLVLAIVAYSSQRRFRAASLEAADANRIADSRRVAAAASTLIVEHGDLHRAILLAVLAWRLSPTYEADAVLRQLAGSSSDVARIIGQYSTDGVHVKGFTHAEDGSPLLLTADSDGNMMLWHIPSGAPASATFKVGQKDPGNPRFSSDGATMLTLNGSPSPNDPGGVVVTNLKSMTSKQFPVQSLPAGFNANTLSPGAAALSPSGRIVGVLDSSNEIAIWDTAGGSISVKSIALKSPLIALTFLDEDRLLLVAGVADRSPYLANGRRIGPSVVLWNRSTNEVRFGPPITVDQNVDLNYSAIFNFDSSKFIIYCNQPTRSMLLYYARDSALHLHQMQLPKNLSSSYDSRSPVMNSSGSRVATFSEERTVVWDFEKSIVLKNVPTYSWLALSLDGRWLAANVNRKINIWDLDDTTGDGGKPLKSACSFDKNDGGEECVHLLCEKVSLQIQDSEDLEASLGGYEFDRLKRLALDKPCYRN